MVKKPDQDPFAIRFPEGATGPALREPRQGLLQTEPLGSELRFYRNYLWCLNAFPTVREVVGHLREELGRVDALEEDWHRAEVVTNIFLLSSAISDTVDDYLLGDSYDFSPAKALLPIGRAVAPLEKLLAGARRFRELRLRRLREWREKWEAAVDGFARCFVTGARPEPDALWRSGARMAPLLMTELPGRLQERRSKIPSAFRSQDLTHLDILTLGRKFAAALPDRQRPVLVVGLRTAGSYFAPLLRACLEAEGYEDLDSVTIRPKKGLASWEGARLARGAARGGVAVIIDEPANTGSTLAKAVDLVRKSGFAARDVAVLIPVHPTRRDWNRGHEFLPLSEVCVLTLEPDEWYKHRRLEPDAVESRLQAYYQKRNYVIARVVASTTAERFNTQLQNLSEEKFHTRLKRVYEVRLQTYTGRIETRYVLAKSVGWGWLGYHAFIAGDRLSDFVPPVLGLRDGILYTEWLPQSDRPPTQQDRDQLLHTAASYVAARVRSMSLGRDPSPLWSRDGYQKGVELLANMLSRAYGWKAAAVLMRGRIRHELSCRACPCPTLVDGKMRREEWIAGSTGLLKTDFEHHGLGKTELNVTDPAYDLAEASLYFGLSRTEENRLIAHYVEKCRDDGVEERLFFNKLLAGTWAMKVALENLAEARLSHRHEEFNRQYVEAWNFLTLQTLRFCATFCRPPATIGWRSPLVVMDIDGVLDKQIFGFPSTTAAGIHALSLLHAHDLAVAVNTARTVADVKEYCEAYGLVGGVAECGGAVWDAVAGRERVLVEAESLSQLEQVGNTLRNIPGVFLNDGYRYSIRAYTYERDVTVPLPTMMIQNVIAELKADRLRFHQTYVDTTVLTAEVDKGRGLLALLELVGQPALETIAIGDSESDLPMFRVSTRSFAPSHISCRSVAGLLRCHITDRAYQRGFLSAARSIVHQSGGRCDRCRSRDDSWPRGRNLFLELLEAADQGRLHLLLRALLDPMALEAFAK